jgi:membrane protein DedA with SNARE-associated domain
MDSVFAWLSHYGSAGLFVLLMLGIAGLPVPDETLLVFSGYLIWRGQMHPVPAFLGAFCGSACGISLSYVVGRTLGYGAIRRFGRYVHLTEERMERVDGWFRRVGNWALTFGYFIPGVRHFTALAAGISRLPYWQFARFAYAGAALWVASFLTLGFFVGENWRNVLEVVHRYVLLVSACALLAGVVFWYFRRRRAKKSAASSLH